MLPGPETAVFGCQAPYAPTQKQPYITDLLGKTLRPPKRPGRARTEGGLWWQSSQPLSRRLLRRSTAFGWPWAVASCAPVYPMRDSPYKQTGGHGMTPAPMATCGWAFAQPAHQRLVLPSPFSPKIAGSSAHSSHFCLLPGPETAVFGCYTPCTPVQKRHTKRIYCGKR